ncbi:hypothetical protein IT575_07575 [bacterium]|nr:hypothetical protein [bacterium]
MRGSIRCLFAFIALCTALSGLSACRQGEGQRARTGSSAGKSQNSAQLSAWLNPLAQIGQSQRLITGSGEDLRQAQYLRGDSAEPQIMALLRNYQDRSQTRPDKMRILRLLPGQTQPSEVRAGAAQPLRLIVAPDKSSWAWAAWHQADGAVVESGRVLLVDGRQSLEASAAGEAASATIGADTTASGPGLWPLSFAAQGHLACRRLKKMQLYNGLPMPQLDHAAQLELFELRSGKTQSTSSQLYLPGPDGLSAAGCQITHDPALPAQATMNFQTGSAAGTRPRQIQRWQLPYFVTYTPYDWEASIAWADPSSLIVLAFEPDAMGPAEKPNSGGIFRLLRLDAQDGSSQLIEDRVLATTGIVAGDGVVFFAVSPGPNSSGGGWELWASSADGMHKQRLYGAMNTLGLEPVDLLDGRRLLVHHQYFDDAASNPVLRSALIEFNLDAASGSSAPLVQLDPLPQAQGVEESAEEGATEPADGSADLFNKGAKPRGEDSGFIPDSPGDGGSGDSGGSGGGAWDGTGPPPIDPD